MRFKPIKTYAKSWGDYAIPENINNLIQDFKVTSWLEFYEIANMNQKASAIERALIRGRITERKDDYGELDYPPIDHAAFMKCEDGTIFLLTMPYGNLKSFYTQFNNMIDKYRTKKTSLEDSSNVELAAAIIDNKYKIRKNGNLVAIIATPKKLKAMGLLYG